MQSLLLAAGFVLAFYSKPDIHIWLNGHNSGFFDWVFSHVTFLGDGIFVICIAVLLLFYSLRSSVFLLTAYLSTGLVVQILKRIVFADYQRPVKFFHDTVAAASCGWSAPAEWTQFSFRPFCQRICAFSQPCHDQPQPVHQGNLFHPCLHCGLFKSIPVPAFPCGYICRITDRCNRNTGLVSCLLQEGPEMASMVADKIREQMNKANDRSLTLYYAGIFIISCPAVYSISWTGAFIRLG